MSTTINYIYDNNLQWQPSFRDTLETPGHFGYRGELIITQGDFLSPEKQLPPKTIFKHAVIVADETSTLLFATQLADFADFKTAFEVYKPMLSPTTLITLFVDNLLSDAVFEYEGMTINAFSLDESSVWNELISHGDLDKKELKRMSAPAKLDAIYAGIKDASLYLPAKTYEETLALKMG